MDAPATACADYLEHLRVQRRLSPRTLVNYRRDLDDLLARIGARALDAVGSTDVRGWVAALHAAGMSPRAIAARLSAWRGLYAWLGRHGRLAHNPVQDVRAPKAPRPLPDALSVEQAVALAGYQSDGDAATAPASAAAPARDRVGAARVRAVAELLYSSGLRVSELVGLDLHYQRDGAYASRGWVDWDGASVQVLGKGGKRRSVPVGAPALAALRDWVALRPASAADADIDDRAALFVGPRGGRLRAQRVWSELRARAREAGIDAAVHPHMLRHSFASHLLQSSGDLRAVQELLGHANIASTQIYTRLDFQHLARVYDAAHPRARKTKP